MFTGVVLSRLATFNPNRSPFRFAYGSNSVFSAMHPAPTPRTPLSQPPSHPPQGINDLIENLPVEACVVTHLLASSSLHTVEYIYKLCLPPNIAPQP